VRGSVTALPVREARFDCVICSQVIEHLPENPVIFEELLRVLRPGGLLILGTPDYATIGWRAIEPVYALVLPGGYRDQRITHYTRDRLVAFAAQHNLEIVDTAYVCRSELILAMRKRPVAGAGCDSAAPVVSPE
jgi:SAM-dependent methyltransferase